MKRLIRYLLQGILYTVPLFITIWVIAQIIFSVGSAVEKIGISIHPAIDPLIGIIAVSVFLILLGALGSSLLFYPLFNRFEVLIEKAPLVKIIYTSVKDLLSAFVGQKKKFNKPVIVTLNLQPEIERLGYITRKSLEDLHIKEGKVAVYLPLSYSLSGDLIIVSKEYVRPIEVNSTELMKFIVSGGVTDIEKH